MVYALFIKWDVALYDKATDTPACATNTAINEDLGQVR